MKKNTKAVAANVAAKKQPKAKSPAPEEPKVASSDLEKSEVYLLELMTNKEAKDLPPNPDGENGVRAEKAARALAHFVKVGDSSSLDGSVGDLLAALMHYGDRAGVSFESALQDAYFRYGVDTGR